MKAMILAAGRGERMRPLTDHSPKPLLSVAGKPLLQWHIERLRDAGFDDLVINTGWLGEQLPAFFGDGRSLGVNIRWSHEGWPAYETAGGLATALPLLGDEPFVLVNGDIATDYPFTALRSCLAADALVHLVLVENPPHHPGGDFALKNGRAGLGAPALTFSGISVMRPQLLSDVPARQAAKLAPILRAAIEAEKVSAECYSGFWLDVGTPERLEQAGQFLADTH